MADAGGGENSIVLSSTQTIKTCCELAEHLRERLSVADTLIVDASALAEGDITLVQILLAARKSATSNGCEFEIRNPSPAFVALVRQSGVSAM